MQNWIREHKDYIAIAVASAGVIVAILIFLIPQIPDWYEDYDKDGFGNPEVKKIALWQPSGFVRNGMDCYDRNSDANPIAEKFFAAHRGDGKFDYDCNGDSIKEQTIAGSCSNGTANQGWNGAIPACGQKGEWLVDCDRKFIPGVPPKIEVVRETKSRIQMCR